jgi:hypothetical protein
MTTSNVLFFILGIGIASTSRILNDPYGFFDSLWPGLVGFMVATASLIITHARAHAAKFQVGIYINHTNAWLIRGAIGISIACLIHAYYFHINKVAELCCFGMFYFGLFFDTALNHYRSLPLDYINSGANGSFIDQIFAFKGGRELLVTLEVIGFVLTLIYYIK